MEPLRASLGLHLELLGRALQHGGQTDSEQRAELQSGWAALRELVLDPAEAAGEVSARPEPVCKGLAREASDADSHGPTVGAVRLHEDRLHEDELPSKGSPALPVWHARRRSRKTTTDSILSRFSKGRRSVMRSSSTLSSMNRAVERERSASAVEDDILVSLSYIGSERRKKSLAAALISHVFFEIFFGLTLTANMVLMAIEEQYVGSIIGYEISYYDSYGSPEYNARFMPGAADFFVYAEYVFTVLYVFEAVARMCGRGRAYWKDPCELYDFFIVICAIAGILLDTSQLPIDAQLFKVLRTVKVLRLARLARQINGMEGLQLMTTALNASGTALLWAAIMLFVLQTLVAIIITNIVRAQYLRLDGSLNAEQREECFGYFGTYARSMLSMFELSLGNWPTLARFITDNLHEGWMVFAVVYKLTFGFAVIGVINAVFVQETFNVASTDDTIMVQTKNRAANMHRKKMEMLFKRADVSGCGEITCKDFRRVLWDSSIEKWLGAMGLDVSDAELLFMLLKKDDRSTLTVDELIKGAAKLKGPASSIDLQIAIKAMTEQWAPVETAGGWHRQTSPSRHPHNFISNMSRKSEHSTMSGQSGAPAGFVPVL